MKLTDRPNFEEFNSAMHSSHMVFNGITYIRADIVDELVEALTWIDNRCPKQILEQEPHKAHWEAAHDAGACARAALKKLEDV